MSCLTYKDFRLLLGPYFPKSCTNFISANDWRYQHLSPDREMALCETLLERCKTKDFSIADPDNKARWERGWGENLTAFEKTGDTGALQPKYIRAGQPMRIQGHFADVVDPNFEANWYRLMQEYIGQSYFSDMNEIYEFGCGSGVNIAVLAEMFPSKKLVGLDWVQPSVDILTRMNNKNVSGKLFNFFEPDDVVEFGPKSAVFTFGALEQTGDQWEPFIQWLLERRPSLCVFVEPIYEMYDAEKFGIDYVAQEIHRTRNFMIGLDPYLRDLAQDGKIEIVKRQRSFIGSLLLEGYSQIVWRPL